MQELENFAQQIKKEGFKHILLLGMGGSSLAPEMFRTCLPAKKNYPKLHVLDSTDPGWIDVIEKSIQIKKTLFIFASKSGTTIEPLSFFRYFYEKSGKRGEQFIAITDSGTFLEKLAKEKNFKKIFVNPSDIGGRFSALSYFGLVPCALAGMDAEKIISSAVRMMRACSSSISIEKNPGIVLGVLLGSLAKLSKDKMTLILSNKLKDFGLWIEQLVAESSGKEGNGIIPVTGEAILKSEDYGNDRLFVFVSLKEDKKIEESVKLLGLKHPKVWIKLKEPTSLGGEFFRWEIATAVACSILKVNAFDQPDVQSAKDKTHVLLQELKAKSHFLSPPFHIQGDFFSISVSRASKNILGETNSNISTLVTNFLRQGHLGEYIGLLAFLHCAPRLKKELIHLRCALQKFTNLPVLFGYGPRYLHSTGQLSKGGPNTGLFIILTADPEKDLPVPDEHYSFGQLERAQAIGDFQALDKRERRLLWIDLKVPLEKSLEELNKTFAISNSGKR